MGFSTRLEECLAIKKMNQTELARLIGIRRGSISDWKKNDSYPYADVAQKIAEILDTTVEYLVTGKMDRAIPSGKVRDIVDIICTLNDDKLDTVYMMVSGLNPTSNVKTATSAG